MLSHRYYQLRNLVTRACWRADAHAELVRLVKHLATLDITPMYKQQTSISSPRPSAQPSGLRLSSPRLHYRANLHDGARLCLELVLALRSAVRDKLVCDVHEIDKWPVRESDLTTVLLEMIGVNTEDIYHAFGVSKRYCARYVHPVSYTHLTLPTIYSV